MPSKHVPMRRCIGCMESKPQEELIRISLWEGKLTVDAKGDAPGRGSYLCLSGECLAAARKKKSLMRTYRGKIRIDEAEALLDQIENLI